MPATVRVAKGARWSCEASGFCCRLFSLGPIEPEIIAGLEQRDIASHWPPAAEAPWYEQKPGPDGPAFFFRKKDGACVFLQPDNLCAIHARFGAEAKPGFCREYPFYVVQDPKGFVVITRPDCAGWCGSAAGGQPVAEQVHEFLSLPGLRSVGRYLHDSVPVLPGLDVPIARWMDIEARVVRELGDQGGPPEALARYLREAIAHDLEVDFPAPDPDRYRLAARAVFETMRMLLDHVLANEPDGEEAQVRFTSEMRTHIDAAVERIDQPLPTLDAGAEEWFNLVLRSHLLGKLFHPMGSVGGGVGRLLAGAVVSRHAPPPSDIPLTAAQVGGIYSPWARLATNRTIHAVLKKASPALVDLFLHAGAGPRSA